MGIFTRSMLITSGPALARALYDREQEGLPSLQTLIYKTCSFWNWLWPLPHLQWTSALHCMGFLISLRCSLCSLISHVLFFCWDIKVCTVTLAHSWTLTAYPDTCMHAHTQHTHTHTHTHTQTWSCKERDKLLCRMSQFNNFLIAILFVFLISKIF